MPRVIAFDVNETLLDLRLLDPLFERLFGTAALRAQWFAQMETQGLVAQTSVGAGGHRRRELRPQSHQRAVEQMRRSIEPRSLPS